MRIGDDSKHVAERVQKLGHKNVAADILNTTIRLLTKFGGLIS